MDSNRPQSSIREQGKTTEIVALLAESRRVAAESAAIRRRSIAATIRLHEQRF
jgi:hypothetical protein